MYKPLYILASIVVTFYADISSSSSSQNLGICIFACATAASAAPALLYRIPAKSYTNAAFYATVPIFPCPKFPFFSLFLSFLLKAAAGIPGTTSSSAATQPLLLALPLHYHTMLVKPCQHVIFFAREKEKSEGLSQLFYMLCFHYSSRFPLYTVPHTLYILTQGISCTASQTRIKSNSLSPFLPGLLPSSLLHKFSLPFSHRQNFFLSLFGPLSFFHSFSSVLPLAIVACVCNSHSLYTFFSLSPFPVVTININLHQQTKSLSSSLRCRHHHLFFCLHCTPNSYLCHATTFNVFTQKIKTHFFSVSHSSHGSMVQQK